MKGPSPIASHEAMVSEQISAINLWQEMTCVMTVTVSRSQENDAPSPFQVRFSALRPRLYLWPAGADPRFSHPVLCHCRSRQMREPLVAKIRGLD